MRPGFARAKPWGTLRSNELRGARTLFFVAVLVSLGALVSGANAQAKNEFAGMIGRTFISDHAATDTATPGALVTSSAGLTFEVNYGRRLKDFGIVGLTGRCPPRSTSIKKFITT